MDEIDRLALKPGGVMESARSQGELFRGIDPAVTIVHDDGRMSVSVPLPDAPAPVPRRYEVRRDAMVVEGHALAGVELAGSPIGQADGAAPAAASGGGAPAS